MRAQKYKGLFAEYAADFETVKLSIYIPSKDSEGREVDATPFRMRACGLLASIAGGATVQTCDGVWIGDGLRVISEPVSKVYTYLSEACLSEHAPKILSFLKELRVELKQACVGFSVDSQFYLVS